MNIFIIGGGAFGTSFANQLSYNKKNKITLVVRRKSQAIEINEQRSNKKYFPNKKLKKKIFATTNALELNKADVIFVAIPSGKIQEVFDSLIANVSKNTLIINLSKGLLNDGSTIIGYFRVNLGHENIVSLKGPTFASEIMNNAHSMFTLGFNSNEQYRLVNRVLKGTNFHLDYTMDVHGVEILSVLKNIYAIILGVVDAQYNSENTRFMVLTKCFTEMKILLVQLGGKEDTLFLSCGFGDLGITALNDLSRNRTLGLLIGKGFYHHQDNTSKNSVVLEGIKTVGIIRETLSIEVRDRLPLFTKIDNFFTNKQKPFVFKFNSLMNNKMKTVLTYGTFDLLHYGHLEILNRSKRLGDRLIIGLSTDEFNKIKGKQCKISFEKRKELLEAVEYVDLVIPESNWDQKIQDVIDYDVDVFVMGDDWEGKFDFLKEHCEVVYLPRTIGISTTKLKSILDK